MTPVNCCDPQQLLFQAALMACRAHPQNGVAAHQAFLTALAAQGVRTRRLPDWILESVQGAVERSVGDPRAAARRILNDLSPMITWLRLRPLQETPNGVCAQAA